MENLLLEAMQGQGIWAIACICLVMYVLRETDKREDRSIERENQLLDIIDGFKEHFGQLAEKVNIIKNDVDDIKDHIKKGDESNGEV